MGQILRENREFFNGEGSFGETREVLAKAVRWDKPFRYFD
jgi:hypothetical protein